MTTEHRTARRTVAVPMAEPAPRAARELVRRTLHEVLRDDGRGMPAAVVDDAELAVSELVTNAVRHGGPPIALRLVVTDDRVSIEVRDGGNGHPVLRRPDADAVSGRGLALVRAVAEEWGVRQDGAGKVVHATLLLRRAPAAA
ncbi:ATP-binding protein [Kitasatospora paranensis]|uniref:ATP-binding protein n=1 Tax=Kitasatospora paranensis TaxID=258053 RepID=A0ABW2G7B7_9ACTN